MACAPGVVGRQRIANDLRELGLTAGDTVMLHAAVSRIGWIAGGPDEVLRGILDVVGERGTLTMYVGWDGSPYDITVGAATLPETLIEAWPPYDPRSSRAMRTWSVLAEYLRTWPGALRSAHPSSSFAAVGENAEMLVRDHSLQYGMGERSPLARLCDLGGRVLLLGSPLANVTLLHHAEHLARVDGKEIVRYAAPILEDGHKVWVEIEEFRTEGCLPWFGSDDMFTAIVRDYLQAGQGATGRVGAAPSYLFDARHLVDFAVEWIEEKFAEPIDAFTGFDVRPAERNDERELGSLIARMHEELTGEALSSSLAVRRVDEILEERDTSVDVACCDDEIIGFVVWSSVSRERARIDSAYVLPEYRRRGILRELDAEISGKVRDHGCHTMELRVPAESRVARVAWRALGYAMSEEILERSM